MKQHLLAAALLSTLAFGPAPAHAQYYAPSPPRYLTWQCVPDGNGGHYNERVWTYSPVDRLCVYYGGDPRGYVWLGFGGGFHGYHGGGHHH